MTQYGPHTGGTARAAKRFQIRDRERRHKLNARLMILRPHHPRMDTHLAVEERHRRILRKVPQVVKPSACGTDVP